MKKEITAALSAAILLPCLLVPASAKGTEQRNIIQYEEYSMYRLGQFCDALGRDNPFTPDSTTNDGCLNSFLSDEEELAFTTAFGSVHTDKEDFKINSVTITVSNDGTEFQVEKMLHLMAAVSVLEYDEEDEMVLKFTTGDTPYTRVFDIVQNNILPVIQKNLKDKSTWGRYELAYSGNYDYYVTVFYLDFFDSVSVCVYAEAREE